MPASRSLIALLVGTVAFFALWIVALKPSGNKSSSQGLGQYQSAINKAHQAVGTSNASNAASGNAGAGSSQTTSTTATSGGASAASKTTAASKASKTSSASKTSRSTASTTKGTASTTKSHPVTKSKPVVHLTAKVGARNPATLARLSTVQSALAAHKTVVMLFYNPQGADDQAVRQELAGLPTSKGRVVKVDIPLSESANFTAVTQQVPVNFSPTLVLIAPSGQTEELPGLTDQFTIRQSVINDTQPGR